VITSVITYNIPGINETVSTNPNATTPSSGDNGSSGSEGSDGDNGFK
jgi:hypothetical protein